MQYIDSYVSKDSFLGKLMTINVPNIIKDSTNRFSVREIELMIKNKQHAFSNEALSALSTNDNHFRKYRHSSDKFLGRVIGVIDGDIKGFVQHMCHLYYDNTFVHEFFYTLKNEKTNEFFVLLKKEVHGTSIYLSSEEIFNYYKKNKEEVFKTTLMDSVYNYRIADNDYKYRFLNKSNIYTDRNVNIEDLSDTLIKVFPFYKKKLDEKLKRVEFCNSYLYLDDFFYKDYLMPFLNQFSLVHFFSDSFQSIDEEILSNMIKQKTSLGMFKQLIPTANKETIEILNAIISCERNLGRHEHDNYIDLGSFNLSILSIFENSNQLNNFLSLIHSSNETEYIYFFKESPEVEDFYRNILPSFYTSKVKCQNNIIKTLKMYLEKVEADLDAQEEAYNKGLAELECGCGRDEDYCECEMDYRSENAALGDNNFAIVMNLMEDTYKSYKALKDLYSKQNEKTKTKIDTLLSKKINDIELIHNELADMVSELKDDKISFKQASLKENHLNLNDLELFEVLDNITLKRVGREMHHCVASYENDIKAERTSIFVVKRENEFVGCLEINNQMNHLAQAKSKYNMKILEEDVLDVIRLFVNKNNLKVVTNDISIKATV